MASGYRHFREVNELMAVAEDKLNQELDNNKDAAQSSIETVMGYLQKIEADVLKAGSDKLAALGYPIDLATVAELFKSNVNTCVTNEAARSGAQGIIGEMSSCVSSDVEALKGLLKDMHSWWNTATTLPGSVLTVANQCREHASDVPGNVPEAPSLVESNHDLDPVANDIMDKAALTRSKRAIWGLGRITRCMKSLYTMAKNDLIIIPGQMLSTAVNAYKVYQSASNSGEIAECIQNKTTQVLPSLLKLTSGLATCMSTANLDAIMAANPKLANLKTMLDVCNKVSQMPTSALGAASAVLGGGASALGDAASAVLNGNAASTLTGAASAVLNGNAASTLTGAASAMLGGNAGSTLTGAASAVLGGGASSALTGKVFALGGAASAVLGGAPASTANDATNGGVTSGLTGAVTGTVGRFLGR